MQWIEAPRLSRRDLADNCVQHLSPELRHRLSRQLGLVIHGAGSRRPSARLWVRTSQLSDTRSLSTPARAADEDLTWRCRVGLTEWPEGAAPSDGSKGRRFEPRRCHTCARRAQCGNLLVCFHAVLPRQRCRRAYASVPAAPPKWRAFRRHSSQRWLSQGTGHCAQHR